MMRPRIGFLGVGWIGRHRMEAMLATGLVSEAAICDPNEDMAREALATAPDAQRVGSFEELLALKPDGIVIATPSAMHAEQCIAALRAGAAVFCQKPLGRNAGEVGAVLDAARNVAGTAMVVAAFAGGRLELLSAMADDRLHEPYRAQHMTQLPGLVAAARDAGALGAALSGAGSAVLALAEGSSSAERVAASMSEAARQSKLAGRAVVVRPAAHGARIGGMPKR